jgi:hypothetical protein
VTARRIVDLVLAVGFGFAGGVVVHYVLYRLGLPLKPFIYVAF